MSHVQLVIPNHPAEIATVARALDELAATHALPPDAVADMQVALDEVLANVIAHAWPAGGRHEVHVRLAVVDGVLAAEVEDDGVAFDPLTLPPPPDLGAPLHARRIGGLGVHFVRRLMSRVRYARLDNRNRLVLERDLHEPKEGSSRGTG